MNDNGYTDEDECYDENIAFEYRKDRLLKAQLLKDNEFLVLTIIKLKKQIVLLNKGYRRTSL